MTDLDFNTIKKLALEQPDFSGRLRTVQGIRITPKNFAEIETAVNAFNKEKEDTVGASYVRGIEASKTFKDAWSRLAKAQGGEWAMTEFLPLKAAFDIKTASLDEVYIGALQIRAYDTEVSLRITEALERAYNNPDGLMEDDRKEMQEIAAQVAKLNEAIGRMAKKYAQKLRAGTPQAP